ncbi:hypothetical protein SAMN05660443_1820 [Marinospirillum celere]|uniref:Outer membrane protein beta-barrel domain-containing protein n=1 Tax=Marinospirillum celere TaxID=1122252 RepID=A0A1I1HCQ2_9GAMM|nr:hypothetical protein [Marinospirillum celere]SFC19253.1 hypothetical protein SAMN05660443_1820 [Marinospirillum celere]
MKRLLIAQLTSLLVLGFFLTPVWAQSSAAASESSVTEASQRGTAVFLTPSVSYKSLDHKSSAADFQLDAHLFQLNVDFEVIGENFAYHRLSLGRTFNDSSEQTSATDESARVLHSHFSYQVGAMNLSLPAGGDLAIWTGVGWQGTEVRDNPEGKSRMQYAYLPFGLDIGMRFDHSSFLIVGGEYRVLVKGWERYSGGTTASPTQADGYGYAGWVGLDYVFDNGRTLTSRVKLEHWTVDESAADDLADSRSRSLSLALGVRF